ncbi:MAG: hypothetical protein EBY22_17985, partial [Gammaproteobacteria bacterium]|nr:hypothetical protein [Gammaproteobacteria bacterium]
IDPIALLFQSGYLTIKDAYIDDQEQIFNLKIPNREVRQALNSQFISGYAGLTSLKLDSRLQMKKELSTGDVASLIKTIKGLFAGIPWRNFTNNDLANFEGYYASVLYAFFASINARVIPEDITNHGQADMTIIFRNHIYVIEIKVVDNLPEGNNQALQQIIQRNYAEKTTSNKDNPKNQGRVIGDHRMCKKQASKHKTDRRVKRTSVQRLLRCIERKRYQHHC